MKTSTCSLSGLICACSIFTAGAQPDSSKLDSYVFKAPLSLTAGAPVQRVAVPVEALLRLQASDFSDLRVFNGQGQAVPVALLPAPDPVAQEQRISVRAWPILGPSDRGGALGNSGALRIEEQKGQRVISLDLGPTSADNWQDSRQVLGALLDVRDISANVRALLLDVEFPSAQALTFEVHASKDLKKWQSVGETVLYRAANGSGDVAHELGSQRVELSVGALKDHYLRISWPSSVDAQAVKVKGATLLVMQRGARERLRAAVVTPTLTNAHELSLVLPFATPIAGFTIRPIGENVLIPVNVLGRHERSQMWAPLASTVLYHLSTQGRQQLNADINLRGTGLREFRVEADKNSMGFTAAPAVEVLFDPVNLAFVAAGSGPFTLAAGLKGAARIYLPISSLLPAYQTGQEQELALAQLDLPAAGSLPVVDASERTGNKPELRSLILWAVLLGGVALLGLMAWLLMKQVRQQSPKDGAAEFKSDAA